MDSEAYITQAWFFTSEAALEAGGDHKFAEVFLFSNFLHLDDTKEVA